MIPNPAGRAKRRGLTGKDESLAPLVRGQTRQRIGYRARDARRAINSRKAPKASMERPE